MKKNILKRIITTIIIFSITIIPISANAEWKRDSKGWWNTEGSSWSIGWRQIDGKWYYFGQNGYMKTGWIQDNGKWYYLKEDGSMLSNTVTPDGYTVNEDGMWEINVPKIEDKILASSSETIVDNNTKTEENIKKDDTENTSSDTETTSTKKKRKSSSSSSSSDKSNNVNGDLYGKTITIYYLPNSGKILRVSAQGRPDVNWEWDGQKCDNMVLMWADYGESRDIVICSMADNYIVKDGKVVLKTNEDTQKDEVINKNNINDVTTGSSVTI